MQAVANSKKESCYFLFASVLVSSCATNASPFSPESTRLLSRGPNLQNFKGLRRTSGLVLRDSVTQIAKKLAGLFYLVANSSL